MKTTKISAVEGDITRIKTDAIVTAINSQGLWYGGIDGAIQRAAGNLYHCQAQRAMPLKNLQTVIAKRYGERNLGLFEDVVFVVDDLASPLNQVVYTGLEAASNEGYQNILVPTIRMGVMNGVVEKTEVEAIGKMAKGVNEFLSKYAKQTKLEDITFVVYNNPVLAKKLDKALRS